LPHLIGTKRENNSMLQWRNGVYELFEYIPGQSYPQTLESTFDSGRVLALYHKLLEEFKSEWTPPAGSYHGASVVEQGIKSIMSGLSAASDHGGPDISKVLAYLSQSYRQAADQVDKLGIETWPKQIVHADWHPGNMLYRDNHVVAVIDYDSARLLPKIIDIANGALQFSIIGGDDDVAKWPDYVDQARFKRFLRGYDEVALLSQAEIRSMPWLMIEALIAEAVFPIAATGQFGRVDGMPFLLMVQKKIHWLQKNYDAMVSLAEG
jgi:homoserine kinase type II